MGIKEYSRVAAPDAVSAIPKDTLHTWLSTDSGLVYLGYSHLLYFFFDKSTNFGSKVNKDIRNKFAIEAIAQLSAWQLLWSF